MFSNLILEISSMNKLDHEYKRYQNGSFFYLYSAIDKIYKKELQNLVCNHTSEVFNAENAQKSYKNVNELIKCEYLFHSMRNVDEIEAIDDLTNLIEVLYDDDNLDILLLLFFWKFFEMNEKNRKNYQRFLRFWMPFFNFMSDISFDIYDFLQDKNKSEKLVEIESKTNINLKNFMEKYFDDEKISIFFKKILSENELEIKKTVLLIGRDLDLIDSQIKFDFYGHMTLKIAIAKLNKKNDMMIYKLAVLSYLFANYASLESSFSLELGKKDYLSFVRTTDLSYHPQAFVKAFDFAFENYKNGGGDFDYMESFMEVFMYTLPQLHKNSFSEVDPEETYLQVFFHDYGSNYRSRWKDFEFLIFSKQAFDTKTARYFPHRSVKHHLMHIWVDQISDYSNRDNIVDYDLNVYKFYSPHNKIFKDYVSRVSEVIISDSKDYCDFLQSDLEYIMEIMWKFVDYDQEILKSFDLNGLIEKIIKILDGYPYIHLSDASKQTEKLFPLVHFYCEFINCCVNNEINFDRNLANTIFESKFFSKIFESEIDYLDSYFKDNSLKISTLIFLIKTASYSEKVINSDELQAKIYQIFFKYWSGLSGIKSRFDKVLKTQFDKFFTTSTRFFKGKNFDKLSYLIDFFATSYIDDVSNSYRNVFDFYIQNNQESFKEISLTE